MGRIEKKPATETALALFENLTPAAVYGTEEGKGLEAILQKITDEVRKTIIDVSTADGRKAANSLAYKVARSKTTLDDMGKTLVADWKAQAAKVDAERRTIKDRLEALQAEIKKPVDDWEQAEADRVAAHLNAIVAIDDLARFDGEASSAVIAGRLAQLETMLAQGRDWQEFSDQAVAARDVALANLATMKAAAIKREADAAELEALRAEKAERDRKDLEAQQAREAEERRTKTAELVKASEAAAAARAEQAARDAVEAERQRVANAKAAEDAAAAKREQNKRHRTKVINAAIEALIQCGIAAEQSTRVVAAIADGIIPNITINF